MRKRPGRRLPAICLFSAVLLLAAVCFSVWRSYHSLTVTTYRFPTDKAEGPVRLAVMSDLHEHVFGQDNAPLVEAVAEQRPDLILLCGDMLNAYSASSQNSTELVGALSKIAPVYYAWGNHELDYLAAGTSPLEEELVSAGATVLDRAWRDLDIHGTPLRLGGLYDYAFALDDRNSCDPDRMDPEVCRFLTDFQDTERFTLMLSHRPDSFALGEAARTWSIDLVLSGHAHGGQVVLPVLGGVFGGDLGLFSPYLHGMCRKDGRTMAVTSGLGSQRERLPRFHNPPEIMVIDLTPES